MSDQKMAETKTPAAQAATVPAKNDKKKTADPLGIGSPVTAFRKGRAPVDPNESNAQKFKRLAQKRMTRALASIRYVGNLANKSQYEYTDEQRNKILKALADAVTSVVQKFSEGSKKEDSFSL